MERATLGAAVVSAVALALAAVSRELLPGLISLACLSVVTGLGTWSSLVGPDGAKPRRAVSAMLTAVAIATFLVLSASPAALCVPVAAVAAAAVVRRTAWFGLALDLVAVASAAAAVSA